MIARTAFASTFFLAASALAAAGVYAADAEYETWTVRGQSTYVWQRKPGFDAAYSGQNSLATARERSYTFTTTAYLGVRPWRDGELYLNPELTQGVPFSNLTGLGGFPNGEITRVTGSNPKVYRQRLFLRQTWNMGGGSEKVEADLNQLAGSVERNRFVLTVGNFSVLDVFDDNAYAKDPRTQFLNWGNMSYAAFDYAADSRGYAWGAAGEWYRGDWVLRFARMTGPRTPNGLPLDYQLGCHYGDQFEVEHAHMLGSLPGRVRVLAYHNRANLASFRDAAAFGRANPALTDRQWIFQVRNGERDKYGLGINVEQALSDNVGVFARVMASDGRTETYAFTEADASIAVGASIKGTRWGRAQDTVGLSFMRNALSSDRRDYLAAGGISFFIGDGALSYRAETIVEAYYRWNVWKTVSLTADIQRVNNPAYNANRWPVNFFGVRAHAEF